MRLILLVFWGKVSGENRYGDMLTALVGSTGYTPYWWAFKMLNEGGVLAREGEVYIDLDNRIWGRWRSIKSKRVKYIKKSGSRESDNVKKLGREEELIGDGLSLSHCLVVNTP